MLGAVCSLKCYVGNKQAGVLTTCTGGKDRCATNANLGMYACFDSISCTTVAGLECCCTDNCNDPNLSGGKPGECKDKPDLSIASKTMCGALYFTSLLVLFFFQWYSFYCTALLFSFLLFGSIRSRPSWIGFTYTYAYWCANFEYR